MTPRARATRANDRASCAKRNAPVTRQTDVVHLTLPVPPSTNRLWRRWAGRTLKAKPVREYEGQAQDVMAAAGLNPYRPAFPRGDLALVLVWYRARRSGDASNRVKCLEDCLRGWVFADDAQVAVLHIERRDTQPKAARVECWVMPAHRAATFTIPHDLEAAA